MSSHTRPIGTADSRRARVVRLKLVWTGAKTKFATTTCQLDNNLAVYGICRQKKAVGNATDFRKGGLETRFYIYNYTYIPLQRNRLYPTHLSYSKPREHHHNIPRSWKKRLWWILCLLRRLEHFPSFTSPKKKRGRTLAVSPIFFLNETGIFSNWLVPSIFTK